MMLAVVLKNRAAIAYIPVMTTTRGPYWRSSKERQL
jgi:hypothetical protein